MAVLSEMNPSTMLMNESKKTEELRLSRAGENAERLNRGGNAEGSSFRAALKTAGESMESIFETASRTYGVSKKLLMAVAKQESDFNPKAVSHAGAKGVMQLMPETARGLGVTDPFDPYQSIMGGAKLLRDNLKKFGSVPLALAAYNAGAGAVQKYGGVPPYRETQNYVSKIMKTMGDESFSIRSSYNLRRADTGYGDFSALGGISSFSSLSSVLGKESGLDGMGLSMLLKSTGTALLGNQLSGSGSVQGSPGQSSVEQLLSGLNPEGREAAAGDGKEDTITIDRRSFQSLLELLRIQMMMGSGQINMEEI